jgi:hypothetical protein
VALPFFVNWSQSASTGNMPATMGLTLYLDWGVSMAYLVVEAPHFLSAESDVGVRVREWRTGRLRRRLFGGRYGWGVCCGYFLAWPVVVASLCGACGDVRRFCVGQSASWLLLLVSGPCAACVDLWLDVCRFVGLRVLFG